MSWSQHDLLDKTYQMGSTVFNYIIHIFPKLRVIIPFIVSILTKEFIGHNIVHLLPLRALIGLLPRLVTLVTFDWIRSAIGIGGLGLTFSGLFGNLVALSVGIGVEKRMFGFGLFG